MLYSDLPLSSFYFSISFLKAHYVFCIIYIHIPFPLQISMPLYQLGLNIAEGYNITEGFTGKFIGTLKPHDILNATVDPSGVWLGVAYFDC
jgi:hypothetical protein